MVRFKTFLNNLSNTKKTGILIIVVLFALLLIGIPTLARYKNRRVTQNVVVWDGSIASNYQSGDGTKENPYVISNGSELAYFSNELMNYNYEDTYFTLSNDIILNDGIYIFDEKDGIKYLKNSNTYFIRDNTNEYYLNPEQSEADGQLNLLRSLNNFKGTFDGNSFTISGLYLADNKNLKTALFTDLEGTVKNLYIENAVISGGDITSGVISNAKNSYIENIVFDGYVFGTNNSNLEFKNIDISNKNIDVAKESLEEKILLDNSQIVSNNLLSATLTGKVTITNSNFENTELTINGQKITSNEFSIDLENNVLNELSIISNTTDNNVTISLSDLIYSVSYEELLTSGIVGESIDSTIKNVVNKADIISSGNAGGIVGIMINSNLTNSYNNGNISSTKSASGLVNTIVNSTSKIDIKNCYNNGNVPNIIDTIYNSNNINITNLFSAKQTDYAINTINNSQVNVVNSYIIGGLETSSGTINGNFATTTLNDLYNKNNTVLMNYKEFINVGNIVEDEDSLWTYEYNSLPKLYIDDPIANIYASTYSWNDLKNELEEKSFNSKLTFMIDKANIQPLKEIYYYISDSKTPLTIEQIESIDVWNEYANIDDITTEGFYVIYAKVIDYRGRITYLNTDVLILDLSGSSINMTLNDKVWNGSKDNLDYIYLSADTYLNINATDLLSGISSIKYYISNDEVTTKYLDSLSDKEWQEYTTPILCNNADKQVIYVKVLDNSGFVTYANTDYIIKNGYVENNIRLGRNTNNTLNNINITSKSTITLNFNYIDDIELDEGSKHNLISNTLLPKDTKITIIDNKKYKVYTYIIPSEEDLYGYNDSCSSEDETCLKKASYPFTLFKTLKTSVDEFFNESDYQNNIDEDFDVVLDFSNTNISKNYENISIYMAIKNDDNISRSTMDNTIKTFNLYSTIDGTSSDANIFLTSNYDNTTILYNSDSTTNINIATGINYKMKNSSTIYDTRYENMNIGLLMKLVDSNNNVVSKEYLNNMLIKIDETEYAAENDGIFRINLNSGINNVSKSIILATSEGNIKLPVGNYQLLVSNYVSYDGLYSKDILPNEISIPISITNSSSSIKYGFDVNMSDNDKIINKNIGLKSMDFSIIQNGNLKNPNVRVSLYKKNLLTAFDQSYSIVDLKNHVTNTLVSSNDNTYYALENPMKYVGTSETINGFNLTMITSNFENTAYKLIFELYDGDKKIGAIEKKFIIK